MDQKLSLFSAVIPVWRDKTSTSPSRESIGTSRKTGSGNYCKTLSSFQLSDQRLRPFQLLFWSGATRPPLQRVGIPYVLQGKRAPETTAKLWERSNGRIKSYGPFQLLFRSSATTPHLQRVHIPEVLQVKRPPETTVKLWARSNGRIKSYGPFHLLFQSGATRLPIHRVGIP